MSKVVVIVVIIASISGTVVFWPKKPMAPSTMNSINNNNANEFSSKGQGDQAAAFAVVASRLKLGETISSPEFGAGADIRHITLNQLVLTGRMIRVSGNIVQTKNMSDVMIVATNVSSAEAIMIDDTGTINSDGSFDIQFALTTGPGLYEVSLSAPKLEEHERDDISYDTVATWSVRVE